MALETFLHITSAAAWAEATARGVYRPPSLESEGFIHLSLERQWLATAARFYRGQEGLVLLVVRPRSLGAKVKFEAADGDEFPHLYGELSVSSVVAALPLRLDAWGTVLEPDGLTAALHQAALEI